MENTQYSTNAILELSLKQSSSTVENIYINVPVSHTYPISLHNQEAWVDVNTIRSFFK